MQAAEEELRHLQKAEKDLQHRLNMEEIKSKHIETEKIGLQSKLSQLEKMAEDLKNKLKNVVREKDSLSKQLSEEKASKTGQGGSMSASGGSRPSSGNFTITTTSADDVSFTIRDIETAREGQEAILSYLHQICGKIKETLSSDVNPAHPADTEHYSAASRDGPQSTVGLMLDELTIDSMVVGSPAYKSKQLLAGDVIKKIDGQEVTLETLDDALRGCDLPGSAIVISVERQGISGTKDVVLKRLAREALADHVRIFELFTILKEVASRHDEHDQLSILHECMDLLEKI